MSIFDGSHGNDVLMHDDDMSPFSGSGDHANGFGNRGHSISSIASSVSKPVALLPAVDSSTQLSDMSTASSATASTANPNGQRKRRGKKSGEKKDGFAGFTITGSDGASTVATNAAGKVIKRRAARACVSCRNRKVRCDVVETFPCGNCRWDKIECVVQEGRRRR